MQIISTDNINELRKQIQIAKQKKQPVIVQAGDDEFNRKIFENPDINVVINLEQNKRKDYMKQRDSGLNEVLCKLAAKNNIKIGIDLENIKKQEPKQKAVILARIRQNIHLCKKSNAQIIILNSKMHSKQEIASFMLCLGANTKQAKESFN